MIRAPIYPRPPAWVIASVLALAMYAGSAGAQSEFGDPPDPLPPAPPSATADGTSGATPAYAARNTAATRAALGDVIGALEADIAALDALLAWQAEMARSAARDPAATLRQRRAMERCLDSPLAPVCDRLTALFDPALPKDARDAGANSDGGGTP